MKNKTLVGMEVAMVAALMFAGNPEPTMARDTMFAVLMIVLNALFGIALVAGGWRHREQSFNLQGAITFLTMLVPLAALGLVLPYYTPATTSPTLAVFRAVTLIVITIGLYCVFLAVQPADIPTIFGRPLKSRCQMRPRKSASTQALKFARFRSTRHSCSRGCYP